MPLTADLPHRTAWVSDAFALPVAALILTDGVFGNVYGRRKVYLSGLGLCVMGVLVSLCATSVQLLWLGQALAGTGAATLLPVTLAVIGHAVPDFREYAKYIGWWSACMMAAMIVGPLLAGVIVEHAAWQWIFLLTVPVAVVTAAVAVRQLPKSKVPGRAGGDRPGQIFAAVAVIALVYGVIEGAAGSFTDASVLAALVVAVLAGCAFVVMEQRSRALRAGLFILGR